MRVVFFAVLALSIFMNEDTFGGSCAEPDKLIEVAPRPVLQENSSSFRGIGLSSQPDDVRWRAQSLGFETITWKLVGSDVVSSVGICANRIEIGRADFDRAGKMIRLALKQRFFSEKPIFVRRFADDLFEFYDVQPTKVDDDVCFQDVTCFKGVSRYGERFLILRIGSSTELFVRPQ
jgi:hypothetical protein